MRVLITGLRGIPAIEGGVESHCEKLAPRLVEQGFDVTVASRSPYDSASNPREWRGVKLKRFWSPSQTGIEAFVHTLLVFLWACVTRPDLVHVHAVGPGLFTPLARLFGLKVVFTHHGPDYDREKWSALAKNLLITGERLACTQANERIVISQTISDIVKSNYNKDSHLIPNGVEVGDLVAPGPCLEELGLEANQYILQVSRFVPEKRQLDLIRAFEKLNRNNLKLVFAGRVDPDSEYGKRILTEVEQNENIVLTGFRTGSELAELFSNASLFVLPSSHEGLPIALLEALGYGLKVLASDIPANLEVGLGEAHYFELGNIEDLAAKAAAFCAMPQDQATKDEVRLWVQERYNWDQIADSTAKVYKQAIQ